METTSATGLIFDVTTADFAQQVIERSHELPILVDFWAPWCGPCTAMAPQFTAAASTLAGHARLVKLNADHSQMVSTLGVSGIPALILFRDGRIIVHRREG